MKKLFSKIAATVLGLFTFCAPIHASLGSVYLGGEEEPSFKLFGVKKWDKTPSGPEQIPYVISDFRSGEEKEIYTISEVPGGYDNIKDEKRALWQKGKGQAKKVEIYEATFGRVGEHEMSISRSNLYNHPDGSSVRKGLKYVAKIREGKTPRERIVYARNTDEEGNFIKGYDRILFKISYFTNKRGKVDFLNDTKDKLYSGYYIKTADGTTVGEVVGSYFPIDLLAMLVLKGDIEI